MNDDVRKFLYGAIVLFLGIIFIWISILVVTGCGFNLNCQRGQPLVDRTPIPTLLPATLPVQDTSSSEMTVSVHCRVQATDLIGAWVDAGAPETASFEFTDMDGQNCSSTFEEVKPLFVESNFWYPGSLSCVSCHSVDVTISPAQLDLSSYEGIMAGSRRENADSEGTDILGDGNWESSLLFEYLTTSKADVPGHTEAVSGLVIFAGTPLPQPQATATAVPVEEPTTTPTP
jgi:hypothetical protein